MRGVAPPPEEAPLAALAARYSDDEGEEVDRATSGPPEAVQTPPAAPGAGAPAAAAATAAAEAQPASGSDGDGWGDEEEDDEDWDSDDDDLASALEWADLREVQEARGHAGGGGGSLALPGYRPNAHGGALNRPAPAALLPTAGNMGRLDSRFNAGAVRVRDDYLDSLSGSSTLGSAVVNQVRQAGKTAAAAAARSKDRSDRATVEQVLDPRTRMVLFKMLNRGVFTEINGVVSTGKEANVYHATGGKAPDGACTAELAIKVYKTAILVFKDRDRYVVGDSRFQRYCKSNPRKMVKMWAEKEMRNLARLHAAGILCPKPLQLRLHVLVMEFIGENGVAAPRLKDAGLPPQRMRQAYYEMVVMVRDLYQKCRLVHADLSEYNVLVHNNELWCIDVSQAVELDHPRAFDFLREDCQHVNDFFRRAGVATLTVRELFDFAVDPSLGTEGPAMDAELERLMEVATNRPPITAEQEVADAVFAQAYIPKKLDEVMHYERDHARLAEGRDTEGIYYQALAGMKPDMSGARTPSASAAKSPKGKGAKAAAAVVDASQQQQQQPADAAASAEQQQQEQQQQQQPAGAAAGAAPAADVPGSGGASDASSGEEEGPSGTAAAAADAPEAAVKKKRVTFADEQSDDESGSDGSGEWEERPKMSKEQLREQRKAHKKEVKSANAEKRKEKMPKHVKKRATKPGSKKK